MTSLDPALVDVPRDGNQRPGSFVASFDASTLVLSNAAERDKVAASRVAAGLNPVQCQLQSRVDVVAISLCRSGDLETVHHGTFRGRHYLRIRFRQEDVLRCRLQLERRRRPSIGHPIWSRDSPTTDPLPGREGYRHRRRAQS